MIYSAFPLTRMADVLSAQTVMRSYMGPLMLTLVGLAGLVATFFLVTAGIQYMTSSGKPEKLEHAKHVMRNALVGLVIVIAAGTLTSMLSHAYGGTQGAGVENIPSLAAVTPVDTNGGIVDVLVKAIVGLFKNIIESAATPFIKALDYFTHATPLMAENPSVFKLWLTMVAIADVLFVLAIALLGFRVMSSASLGLEEIEFKHMLPQIGFAFLFINTSIFMIDMVISLSNAMIKAAVAAFASASVFDVLSALTKQADKLGLVALMIMVVFMILSVILLVYYVVRLVTLYIGAILSPLVILLWLIPGFKDFSITAMKTYVTTIFVLFVHVIILLLAASIFAGMLKINPDQTLDPIMGIIVGVATLLALIKTQNVMTQISHVSVGPKAMRKLGSQFMTGLSYTTTKIKTARAEGANS